MVRGNSPWWREWTQSQHRDNMSVTVCGVRRSKYSAVTWYITRFSKCVIWVPDPRKSRRYVWNARRLLWTYASIYGSASGEFQRRGLAWVAEIDSGALEWWATDMISWHGLAEYILRVHLECQELGIFWVKPFIIHARRAQIAKHTDYGPDWLNWRQDEIPSAC